MQGIRAPGAPPVVSPAQGQAHNHVMASQMAHAAARNQAIAKVLSGSVPAAPAGNMMSPQAAPGVPPGAANPSMSGAAHPMPANFKAHVISHAHSMGAPGASVQDVHNAIAAHAQAGHLSPAQAQGLTSHDGPLYGPQGANTIKVLGSTVARMKGAPGAQ